MYKRRKGQQSLLEDVRALGGVMELDPENKWVKLGILIPWEDFEAEYAATFPEEERGGQVAKSARMALGTLLIKERYQFSDEDTVEELRMNPYLQHFIGLSEFTHKAPIDASSLTHFRKRITPKMLGKLNDCVLGLKQGEQKDEEAPKDDPPRGTNAGQQSETPEHEQGEGTLILDATCVPQAIRYPTDISLLNEARELLEKMVGAGYQAGGWQKKPRTYCRTARKDYLRYARNRKPSLKQRYKVLKRQLGYVARDIGYIQCLLKANPQTLSERMRAQFETIMRLYEQQRQMYQTRTHSVENRIVSIHQPWVRPIVRGKTNAPVEFGAKIEVALYNGYARIEVLRWEAFNEGGTLQASIARYKAATGHYPTRILADKVFRTRDNLSFCKQHGIRLNGPALGRPPKDKALYREQCRQEKAEAGERNAIECTFGVGKRRYSLGCITTKLQHTSEVAIHLVFLSMNLQKRLRSLLCAFFTRCFPAPPAARRIGVMSLFLKTLLGQ
jgi:hypothetical protein